VNTALDVCEPDCAAPAEFVRLRYFFGQRLGVVDLTDEQAYVVGKLRFHNLRAHGTGVLCGLRGERFVTPQNAPPSTRTTVLKVVRGAALDPCGREILVGWDQCVDVGAWFRQKLPRSADLQAWVAATSPTPPDQRFLWIAVRYRECPSDPMPAPRDPCGCDAGGCEMGRVREGFELSLLTGAEAAACVTREPLPAGAARFNPAEVLDATQEEALARYLNLVIAGDCPETPGDGCLLLAKFLVVIDDSTKQVIDLGAPDNAVPERLSLMSTALLQQQLLRALAADEAAFAFGEGPTLTQVHFAPANAHTGTLVIAVAMGRDSTGGLAGLAGDPASHLKATVSQFKDDGSWAPVAGGTLTYQLSPTRVEISFPAEAFGPAGGRYRLALENQRDTPAVDTLMRPLQPMLFTRHFRLIPGAPDQVALSPTLFD
jgi:hypothetical protein